MSLELEDHFKVVPGGPGREVEYIIHKPLEYVTKAAEDAAEEMGFSIVGWDEDTYTAEKGLTRKWTNLRSGLKPKGSFHISYSPDEYDSPFEMTHKVEFFRRGLIARFNPNDEMEEFLSTLYECLHNYDEEIEEIHGLWTEYLKEWDKEMRQQWEEED